MKKLFLFLCIFASLFLFIGASVWEGTAAVSEDLPETGLYIATNSFPVNTVVDVINLENGKTTSLIVSSRLEIAGFLALLSKDAGNAIDIPNRSVSRIRMSQSADPRAFSHYTGGRITSPAAHDVPLPESPESNEESEISVTEHVIPDYESLALVPSEARPPADAGPVPDPNYFIPQIVSPAPVFHPPAPVESPDPATVQVVAPAPTPTPIPAPSFPAPIISQLETGMYYLQIAAFNRVDAVQAEISRLDSGLPVVIMNAGSSEEPVYRILIGPLNLGESGAMLHRFRSSHRDAFLRQGS